MRGGKGDGHIPRNIRLTLTALDMMYPWVDMMSVALRDDGVNLDVKWRVCWPVVVLHLEIHANLVVLAGPRALLIATDNCGSIWCTGTGCPEGGRHMGGDLSGEGGGGVAYLSHRHAVGEGYHQTGVGGRRHCIQRPRPSHGRVCSGVFAGMD